VEWIQEDCENLLKADLAGWAGFGTKPLQVGRQSLKNTRLHGEEGELPFPAYVNQAAGLEFFDVVRQGGRRDSKRLGGHGTGERALRTGDLLKEFKALGIG